MEPTTSIILAKEKRQRLFLLAAAALLLLSALLLIVHRSAAARIQSEIRTEIAPMTDALRAQAGADSVDLRFAIDPGQRFTLSPGKVKHQVFLTVHCSSLKSKSNSEWIELLLGERGTASVCHSYGESLWDDALYARSVQIPSTPMSYPVFVTVTDGSSCISLQRISLGRTDLSNADLWQRLHPRTSLPSVGLFTFLIVVSGGALALLLYLWIDRRKALDRACAAYYEACLAQGVQELGSASGDALAEGLAEKYAREAGVANATESWRAMFRRGLALRGEKDAPAPAGADASPIAHILRDVDRETRREQLEARKRAKRKALLIGAGAALLLVGVTALVLSLVVRPARRYDEAMALREAGRDSEAYAIFTELGDYRDARELALDYDYLDAIGYLSDGHYARAYLLLSQLDEHPSAAEERARLLQERPFLAFLDVGPGETGVLGRFEQDNDPTDGPEELEWIVLSNSNGVILAVSKDILDARPFDGLMDWIRGEFSAEVFADVEPGFVSAAGLLTRDDLDNYGRYAGLTPSWTPYAKAQQPVSHYYAGLSWWLTDENVPIKGSMFNVTQRGEYAGNICETYHRNGVRPCILIDTTGTVGDPYDKEPVAPVVHSYRPGSGTNSADSGRRVCYRCGGTGRVVLHYGNSWNTKEGYRYGERCGLCGGTGYLDD